MPIVVKKMNIPSIENACALIQDYNARKIFVPSIPELEEFEDNSKYIYLGSMIPKNFIKTYFKFEKKHPLIYVYLSVGELKPYISKSTFEKIFKFII